MELCPVSCLKPQPWTHPLLLNSCPAPHVTCSNDSCRSVVTISPEFKHCLPLWLLLSRSPSFLNLDHRDSFPTSFPSQWACSLAQTLPNRAVRAIMLKFLSEPIPSLLKTFQWLPISLWVNASSYNDYKVPCHVTLPIPHYLSDHISYFLLPFPLLAALQPLWPSHYTWNKPGPSHIRNIILAISFAWNSLPLDAHVVLFLTFFKSLCKCELSRTPYLMTLPETETPSTPPISLLCFSVLHSIYPQSNM